MKIVIIFLLCLCSVRGVKSQGTFFTRFFGCGSRIPCSKNAVCEEINGRSLCFCVIGFRSKKFRCVDIDECLQLPCEANERCVNVPGSYECECKTGYQRRNGKCIVNDECSLQICGANERCVNIPGGHECVCESGYQRREGICIDFDECYLQPCAENERCVNVPGRYQCECESGYQRRNGTCIDPDFCNGRGRTWTTCTGSPPFHVTTDSCEARIENCNIGTLLGELFKTNFLGTDADSSNNGPSILSSITSTGEPSFANINNNDTCFVEGVANSEGSIITGRCVTPSTRTTKNRQAVNNGPRDLLIMLDESGSIGRNRFLKARRLAIAIVRLLCGRLAVGQNTSHVGIITFNRVFTLDIGLNDYYDVDRLVRRIEEHILYVGDFSIDATCLTDALDQANNTFFATSNRQRYASDIKKEIILISDGCENCISRSLRESAIKERTKKFMNQGVNVYIIGIGLDNECKNSLSLLGQGGKCFHFFYIDNWDLDIDNFIEELESNPNSSCPIENTSGQCLRSIG